MAGELKKKHGWRFLTDALIELADDLCGFRPLRGARAIAIESHSDRKSRAAFLLFVSAVIFFTMVSRRRCGFLRRVLTLAHDFVIACRQHQRVVILMHDRHAALA